MNKTYFDSISKIWSGNKSPTIYNSNVSVGYLLLNILQNTPDDITQISHDSGIEITCREMYERSVKIASYLQKLNCKLGDIVGMLALNSDNLAPAVFACLTLGLPINCFSPELSESEIVLFYSNTKPKIIFCDADHVEKVKSVVKRLPVKSQIFMVDRRVDGLQFIGDIVDCECDVETFIIPQFDSNSLAFILATSGTSSVPKQVCKSHKELIEELTVQWKSNSKQIWFSFIGNHWISGIWILLKGTLYGGKRIITTQTFDANLMLQIINQYQVTTTIISAMWLAIFDSESNPLTSMRYLVIGGVSASRKMCETAKTLFPNAKICHSYGASETGLLAINLTNTKLESVGQLYNNVEMKILNEDGDRLGIGEIGEIGFKTPTIFPGYFNNMEKTNEAIRDGWVFLGDLGYFDKDGYLFVTDRKTDILKCEIIVSAFELESIINEINDVVIACVVGAYQKDRGMDTIFAFVVKKPGSALTSKYIEDYVSDRVEDVKKIGGGVHFVQSFPLTVSGKIRRFEIRKWAQEKYDKSIL